ncbi:signal peptidase II [Thalassotalea piscium]|uniref:Lipoprotein signal peptidase n=1 Tax=Thalassotalea piscium TaxID=1230533 RepID=A0A7X0TS96_9GAMM|nr:signal peptidase II [Thalassotalea piscium]MBB6541906.1 signal peptidase II [Thalassotalea piscium]
MNVNKSNTSLRWLWITFVFLILDQVTKQWVANSFELYESVKVFPFFNITYVHNLGAAFSFLADQGGWQRWFFTAIAFVASIVFSVWLKRTPSSQPLLAIALACMLSGALGNLIDRVLFGYVIDFLDFYIGSSHWPAFNVADSMIFIGAALMIIDSFKQEKIKKQTSEAKEH